MVLPVADQDVAIRHHPDSFQTLELCVIRSPAAKGAQETAVRVKDLNTVVTRIGHTNVTLVIDSDTAWELELSLKMESKILH